MAPFIDTSPTAETNTYSIAVLCFAEPLALSGVQNMPALQKCQQLSRGASRLVAILTAWFQIIVTRCVLPLRSSIVG